MSLAVHAFTCGHLTGNFGRLMEGGEGRIRLPIPAYLIEHPKGTALFDTGMHPDCQHDPAARLGARLTGLFEFDYQLEMYKPAARRRWGYFALPILYEDRLVGKVDATADRIAGVFRVDAIHQDVTSDKSMTAAIDHESAALHRSGGCSGRWRG